MTNALSFLSDLRSYLRGSRDRDQRAFYDLESSLPYFDQVNRILCKDKRRVILEFLAPPHAVGDAILEIGCGVGHFARILADRGESVVGIDLSARKIEKARKLSQRYPSRALTFLESDFREFNAESSRQGAAGAFSRILASDVVEHIPWEPAQTVRKLRDLAAPGGQIVVSVPSKMCMNDPGHIWKLLPDEWDQVFRAEGLRVERKQMSRICWYWLKTPLPLAMVFSLRKGDA